MLFAMRQKNPLKPEPLHTVFALHSLYKATSLRFTHNLKQFLVLLSLDKDMASIIDNLTSDWQTVDGSKDADIEGYKEYLICHRLSIDNTKQEFKYSASSVTDDFKPVELVIQGAKGRDPLQGIQRPKLKVKESKVVGIDVDIERCEMKQ